LKDIQIQSLPTENFSAFSCRHRPEMNNFTTSTWLRYVRIFAIANPPVVCNVRAPYSGGWNFRQYYFLRHFVRYLSHPL